MSITARQHVAAEVLGTSFSTEEMEDLNAGAANLAILDIVPERILGSNENFSQEVQNIGEPNIKELDRVLSEAFPSKKKDEKASSSIESGIKEIYQSNINRARLETAGAIIFAAAAYYTSGDPSTLLLGIIPNVLQGANAVWSIAKSHEKINELENSFSPAP